MGIMISRDEIKGPYLKAFERHEYDSHIVRFMNEQIDGVVEARSRFGKPNSDCVNKLPCEHETADGYLMKHLRLSSIYRETGREDDRLASVAAIRQAMKMDQSLVSYMLDW